MEAKNYSWWHDVGLLFVRYSVVALAFIPIGIAYVLLPLAWQENAWVQLLALVAGLPLANFAWRRTAPNPVQASIEDTQQPAGDEVYKPFGTQFATAILAASMFFAFSASTRTASWHSGGGGQNTGSGTTSFYRSEL